MRLGIDATPLLGDRTGIGVYTAALLGGLAARDDVELTATAFSSAGPAALRPMLPAGVAARGWRVPATVLQQAWLRTSVPTAEQLCGPVDVFHGTNFVQPPTRHAASVVSVHDLSFLRYPETVSANSLRYRALVPRSIARSDLVFALTRSAAAEIAEEYGLPEDRLRVVPPGVEDDWFTATAPTEADRARLGLPERYLTAVGTLEPRKNLATLLRAYRALLEEAGDVAPLVLAGAPGWGEALHLQDFPAGQVITPGYLERADLRSLVAGSLALVFPSRYEGFGLPPLEALAAGVPVLASDLPVTREVLGPHARYVAADDEPGWSQALAECTGASWPGGADADSARVWAGRYSWHRTVEAAVAGYADASA